VMSSSGSSSSRSGTLKSEAEQHQSIALCGVSRGQKFFAQ